MGIVAFQSCVHCVYIVQDFAARIRSWSEIMSRLLLRTVKIADRRQCIIIHHLHQINARFSMLAHVGQFPPNMSFLTLSCPVRTLPWGSKCAGLVWHIHPLRTKDKEIEIETSGDDDARNSHPDSQRHTTSSWKPLCCGCGNPHWQSAMNSSISCCGSRVLCPWRWLSVVSVSRSWPMKLTFRATIGRRDLTKRNASSIPMFERAIMYAVAMVVERHTPAWQWNITRLP